MTVRMAAALMVAVALTGCQKPKALKAAPPPVAPLAFTQKTADAKVSLKLDGRLRFHPRLHLKLFTDGKRQLTEFIAQAAEDRPREIAKGYPGPPYSRDVAWSIVAQTGRLISLREDWSEYTGGAHPNHGSTPLLWDKATELPAPQSALFLPNADYGRLDALLCQAVRAEKARRLGPQPADALTCPAWKDSRAFLSQAADGKAAGLTFHFDPYLLGAYAEGDYDIAIPAADFRAALAPPYVREFSAGPAPGR